jgi:hypothetical protein
MRHVYRYKKNQSMKAELYCKGFNILNTQN